METTSPCTFLKAGELLRLRERTVKTRSRVRIKRSGVR
jgi:hypothetical protein